MIPSGPGRPCMILGIKPGLVACKTSTLPCVLPLWSLKIIMVCVYVCVYLFD